MSTELLDVAEAGLLLATGGTPQLMASSTERTRSLELFQLRHEEGPCLKCYRTRTPVIVEDFNAARERWPGFVRKAHSSGFASVHALPLRLQCQPLGSPRTARRPPLVNTRKILNLTGLDRVMTIEA